MKDIVDDVHRERRLEVNNNSLELISDRSLISNALLHTNDVVVTDELSNEALGERSGLSGGKSDERSFGVRDVSGNDGGGSKFHFL